MDQPESVIIFCPTCCTSLDTWSDQREHECSQCGQQWTMEIDMARQAAASI